jgi:purine-binding chemotaxis protein CheW
MERLVEQLQPDVDLRPGHVTPSGVIRVCLIVLGGEYFAIDLRHVREVFELQSITPVPGMPASLVGVANLRGTIVPLADLRPVLGVPASTTLKYVMVVRHEAQQVGILIEGVPEIRTINQDEVAAVSTGGVTESRPFLSGLIKIEDRMGGMVEVSRFLASVEGAIDQHDSGN